MQYSFFQHPRHEPRDLSRWEIVIGAAKVAGKTRTLFVCNKYVLFIDFRN